MRFHALPGKSKKGRVQSMKNALGSGSQRVFVAGGLLFILAVAARVGAEPTAAVTAAYNSYIDQVEARLAQQHRTTGVFLAPEILNCSILQEAITRVHRNDPVLESFE